MTAAREHLERATPAQALARGQALWRSVTPERPVSLYAAWLDAEALVLGAYQYAPHALSQQALVAATPLLRRRTGGATVHVGPGVGYLAIGLAEPGALMGCPPGKLLNRNVRGCLSGLRQLKLPAHYFGRDFISVEARPAAYLAWTEAADGRALLEVFVGVDAPFVPEAAQQGYPARQQPMFRGKAPITLAQAGFDGGVEAALRALCDGQARCYGLELQAEAPSALERDEADALATRLADAWRDAGPPTLHYGEALEEAIGFVAAGVALDPAGKLAALRLVGDFMQHEACPQQLTDALLGALPDARSLGAALDGVYAAGPGLIEGVRSLGTLQEALLSALEGHRARHPISP
ncbi:MAG: hypothetical protein OEZ06_02080 [Myxococcales bacterium]|nr:hypothetical protein [Myxococcales bacterium]